MRRQIKLFAFLLVATVFVGLFLRGVEPHTIGSLKGTVRYVVDGDSLFLTNNPHPIRLWGVDAPEREESGYLEATRALRMMVARETLRCQRIDSDRYKRIVARCYLRNGREINRMMIESGTVSEYYYYTFGFYKWNAGKSPETNKK